MNAQRQDQKSQQRRTLVTNIFVLVGIMLLTSGVGGLNPVVLLDGPQACTLLAGEGKTVTDLIGQQLGNYRVLCRLGQGGFAEVYLSEHIHLRTQAAIKVLHTLLGPETQEHFREEACKI